MLIGASAGIGSSRSACSVGRPPTGEGSPGIVHCEQGARSIGELLELLIVLHGCLTPDEMRNHIEFF